MIRGGVVAGTWHVRGREVTVSWFSEVGQAPRAALYDEVQRLAALQERELRLE